MIYHYRFLDEQIRDVSRAVKMWCRTHREKDYRLLRSVPGVGPLTAAALLTEGGDLRRFSSIKQFASYIGLVPGVFIKAVKRTRPWGSIPGHTNCYAAT
jgi:transposase